MQPHTAGRYNLDRIFVNVDFFRPLTNYCNLAARVKLDFVSREKDVEVSSGRGLVLLFYHATQRAKV